MGKADRIRGMRLSVSHRLLLLLVTILIFVVWKDDGITTLWFHTAHAAIHKSILIPTSDLFPNLDTHLYASGTFFNIVTSNVPFLSWRFLFALIKWDTLVLLVKVGSAVSFCVPGAVLSFKLTEITICLVALTFRLLPQLTFATQTGVLIAPILLSSRVSASISTTVRYSTLSIRASILSCWQSTYSACLIDVVRLKFYILSLTIACFLQVFITFQSTMAKPLRLLNCIVPQFLGSRFPVHLSNIYTSTLNSIFVISFVGEVYGSTGVIRSLSALLHFAGSSPPPSQYWWLVVRW